MKLKIILSIIVFSLILVNFSFAATDLATASLMENRGLSFSMVAVAGLIDGLNPCAIGLVVMLLGYILIFAHQPEKMVKNGVAYIITTFLSYFLIGLVLSHSFLTLMSWEFYPQMHLIVKYLIIAILGFAAIINIKDFFLFGKWFSLGVTPSEKHFLIKYLRKVDWHATVVMALLVVIFQLPCSLPIYLGAISILVDSFPLWEVAIFLLVYCLMFVVPLIIVLAVVYETKHFYKLREAEEKYNKWLKLMLGVVQMVLMGVLIYLL